MRDTKKLITVREMASEWGLGVNKAYDMVNAKDFPAIRMGKKIYVIASKVDEFIEANIGRTF